MFVLLFALFFALGLMSAFDPKKYMLLAIGGALVFPFSNFFAEWHYFNGMMAVDGFFIGLLPYFFFMLRKPELRLNKKLLRILLLSFILFLVYLIWALNSGKTIINLLKDLRPLLHLLEMFMLYELAKNSSFTIRWNVIQRFAILAGISNIIWFLLGFLAFFQFEDLYAQNNSNRYLDLSTYFSLYFILHYQYLRSQEVILSRASKWAFILSIVSILLTNSRVLFLAAIICIGILRTNNFKSKFRFLFWGTCLILIFIQFSALIGQQRVLDSIDSDSFSTQLIERFSPALVLISQMSVQELFFGYGLGIFFEIPWFEYRGLNVMNVSVDSAYLTHFVKQGLLGILFLLACVRYLSFCSIRKLSIVFSVFWLIQFLVEASLFQNIIYGASFYLFLMLKLEDSEYVGEIS